MMSAAFSSSFMDQRPSVFGPGGALQRFSLPPSAGRCEDRGVPFILYPSSMGAPLRGPGPGLLPYLAPFHHHGHFSVYECPFEPAFIQKRNERERQRVKCVNQGYAKLREHLPGQSADRRLSKVETLRAAIRYIKYLQGLVQSPGSESPAADCGGEPSPAGGAQELTCLT
ncbi:achaete-scute homolog 5-like [Thunnus thynnus]|uniref:achaete-scute homolog 5-like n=1 Tax=Thunnus maccoyii TaxID=8240 RepID=UPI001C4AB85B|nr:achaete-scute homolog 5-like [Thunnus maccoyii]